MASFTTQSTYFLCLSIVATNLLWGISVYNGTVVALLQASLRGMFEDGTPFVTTYTGIKMLDFPLSLLVAFFFHGTNGSHRSYQLFLVDAYATLQPAFVWLYVERSRMGGAQPWAVAYPLCWGMLWQCFGAAIALPLFFRQHLTWVDGMRSPLPPANAAAARAVPVSYVLGAVVPAVIGMLPTWRPRSSTPHQKILAAWQLDPCYVSATQALVTWVLAVVFHQRRDADGTPWARFAHLIAAATSALGHFCAVGPLIASSDPVSAFVQAYVPLSLTGPAEASSLQLARGPWLFLQFDLIIISLSCLSWVFLLVTRLLQRGDWQFRVGFAGVLALGSVVLGSGTMVSLTLFGRECLLERRRSQAKQAETKSS